MIKLSWARLPCSHGGGGVSSGTERESLDSVTFIPWLHAGTSRQYRWGAGNAEEKEAGVLLSPASVCSLGVVHSGRLVRFLTWGVYLQMVVWPKDGWTTLFESINHCDQWWYLDAFHSHSWATQPDSRV